MVDEVTSVSDHITMIVPKKASANISQGIERRITRIDGRALNFANDYIEHLQILINSTLDFQSYRAVAYLRASTFPRLPSENSSVKGISDLSRSYYSSIAGRLADLRTVTDDDGEPLVEGGAIDTALLLVNQLEHGEISPPDVTWHGGDAVVMLWTLGETTYAITATEGEFGYVVRQNKTTLRLKDSMPVEQFRLQDLR